MQKYIYVVFGVIGFTLLLFFMIYQNVINVYPSINDDDILTVYANYTKYHINIHPIYTNNTVVVTTPRPEPIIDKVEVTTADTDTSDGWQDDDGSLRYVILSYKPTKVDDDLNCVRRMVGSVQFYEKEKLWTTVFGYDVPEDFYLEIRTFAFVRFITIPAESATTIEAARSYMNATCNRLYSKWLYVNTPKKFMLGKEGLAAKIESANTAGNIVAMNGDKPTEDSFGFIRGVNGSGVSFSMAEYFSDFSQTNDDAHGRCNLLRNLSSPFRTRYVYHHHNENFLKKDARHRPDDTLVCLSIATYSGSDGANMAVDDFSLMSKVMPSFLTSTADVDTPTSRYRFAMYLGIQRDPFYDNPEKFKELTSKIIQQTESRSFSLRVFYTPLNAPAMDITYKWNAIIDQGYRDSCDYIYQYSDDTVFVTPWVNTFIQYLEAESNFGMVGAVDQNNRETMTLAFASRTHVSILGSFWPTHLKNWYSDNWAQQVYGGRYTKQFGDVLMLNTQKQGQRYPACSHHQLMEKLKAEESRPRFVAWLKKQPQTYDIQQKLDYYQKIVEGKKTD